MTKFALLAALPLAFAASGCNNAAAPDAADSTVAAVNSSDDALAADTSAVGPTDTRPAANATAGMTQAQQAEYADEKAESLEKKADRVEPVNEAEAGRLEAEAKRLQDERDAKR
jgi:hypothetical protein